MALWRRKTTPAVPVPPWKGGGLRAAPGEIPGKILLSAGSVQAAVSPRELRDFGRGRLDIVESLGTGPLAFLFRVSAAAPTSIAKEQVRDLPKDAVVLAFPETPPAAILTGTERDSFLEWTQQLTD
ncbi:hypothetical protein [Amycolatopsis silviterrae]|uniref:Uncharacterized protein n=1 Tax=Amycolatopsis silviterrae TaxID=1656914 RepID=A0ABW5H591_9PSEU